MRSIWRGKILAWVPFLGVGHKALYSLFGRLSRFWRLIRLHVRRIWCDSVEETRIRRSGSRLARGEGRMPIVHLYAVCKNEVRLTPWFLQHYESCVDRFFVYDNGSTDGTLELLAGHPRVDIRHFETEGLYDEDAIVSIKNAAWKTSCGQADFVIVCDMDEFLFHPDMPALLSVMMQRKYTLLKPRGYQMVSESLPAFTGTRRLCEICPMGVADFHNYSKQVLFDPNQVDIRYRPGAHRANPQGRIRLFESSRAKLLHYKNVDRAEVLRKTQDYRAIFSPRSLAQGYSRHHRRTDEAVSNDFDYLLKLARNVID